MAEPLYVPLPGRQGRNALNTLTDREIMERDYPDAAYRVYQGKPDMTPVDLDALKQGWQLPPYTVAPESGRVPMFAGPNAMAPPMDRESTNMRDAHFPSALLGALLGKPIRMAHELNFLLGPTPTMQEISDLLPKEQIPDISPETDAARAERERQYYAQRQPK